MSENAKPAPGTSFRGLPILVTGGLGFIGSNVARRLVELGAEVTVVDALLPQHGGNRANLAGFEDRLQIHIVDQRDGDAMRRLVAGRYAIFNLAGQVSHIDSMENPAFDLEVNTLSHISLLEACRACARDAIVVYASTRQIYGKPAYLPVDEHHPLAPVDANGVNKMAGEFYHTLYHRVYDMKTASLRLTNTFGPRMLIKNARQTFLGIWLRKVVEDDAFEVWGGAQLRDFTYVDDVVDAFLLAASTPDAWGQVLNIGGVPPMSLAELARLLIEVAGSGRAVVREFPPDRKRIDIGDYHADDRRFRDLTGWRPTTDMREGLTRSVAYYRQHLSSYL